MSFFEAIQSGFRGYVQFRGRAARSEYWYWALFTVLGSLCLSILDAALFPIDVAPLYSIFSVIIFLPSLAVSVRRLHDTDRSGWWLLVFLVPLIGFIVLIVWFCMRESDEPNRFGPSPLGLVQ